MPAYNHLCEDCGHEWEADHSNDKQADAALCPKCNSEDTQANRAN